MMEKKRFWDGNNYVIKDLSWIKEQIVKISDLRKDDLGRDLIITPIKDKYKEVGSIFFSLNGSPPRGHAILIGIDRANGKISFISWGLGKKKTYQNTQIEKKLLNNILKTGVSPGSRIKSENKKS